MVERFSFILGKLKSLPSGESDEVVIVEARLHKDVIEHCWREMAMQHKTILKKSARIRTKLLFIERDSRIGEEICRGT